MKVLVTGAAGFLGLRICTHLEDSGHEVVRVVHRGAKEPYSYAVDVSEISSFAILDNIVNVDAIVHCAGIAHRFGRVNRQEFARVNVEGAHNIARFAKSRSVQHIILLSSVMVYGESTQYEVIDETHPIRPIDDYSWSKAEGERVLHEFCAKTGIRLTILRPAPVLGEGSHGNVFRLIDAIANKRFLWIGDGRNKRSFVYVGDVARAVESMLTTNLGSGVYNVVGGTIRVSDLVESIAETLNLPAPKKPVPHLAAQFALKASTPMKFVPVLASLHRTLRSWLANAAYSGEKLEHTGFVAKTAVRKALLREIHAYESKNR